MSLNITCFSDFQDQLFARELQNLKDGSLLNSSTNKSFKNGSYPLILLVDNTRGLKSSFWSEQFRDLTMNLCPVKCKVTDDLGMAGSADSILF